jgi:hypothetical protein
MQTRLISWTTASLGSEQMAPQKMIKLEQSIPEYPVLAFAAEI